MAPSHGADRRGGESLDRVLPQIRATVPGRFYDAEGPFFSPSGEPTYRIKWMTPDGRLIWFSVDARTGQVIGGRPGASRGGGRENDRGDRPDRPDRYDSDNRGSSWNRDNFRDEGGWNRNDSANWNRIWQRSRDEERRSEEEMNGRGRDWDSSTQGRPRYDRRDPNRNNADRSNSERSNSDRGNSGRGADHRGRDGNNGRHDRNGE